MAILGRENIERLKNGVSRGCYNGCFRFEINEFGQQNSKFYDKEYTPEEINNYRKYAGCQDWLCKQIVEPHMRTFFSRCPCGCTAKDKLWKRVNIMIKTGHTID